MCLIIHAPTGIDIPKDKIITAWENNKDGMGIMTFKDGKIRSLRSMANTPEKVLANWNRFKNNNVALHFRTATSGDICKDMAHPFRILSKKTDGTDLFMMHNGVLSGMPTHTKSGSDTWHFIEDMLKPFLHNYGANILQDAFFINMLEDYVGRTNKLLFLDGEGNWSYVNKEQGSETIIPGCWASNTYSLAKRTPIVPFGVSNSKINRVLHPVRNDDPAQWSFPSSSKERTVTKAPFTSSTPKADPPVSIENTQDDNNLDELTDSRPSVDFYGGYALDEVTEKSDAELFQFVVRNPEDAADILRDMASTLEDFDKSINSIPFMRGNY